MKTKLHHSITALLFALVAFVCSHAVAAESKPLKVFILAGQSNMEGQAVVDLEGKDYNDGRGTLATLLRDPANGAMFKHLQDAHGKWTVRDDVWVRYQRERGPLLAGPLGLGFSVYGDAHHFGPELQFGHVLGDHLGNQVLLIKTAWGGKSLFEDFRPPSSGGEVGKYYTLMIAQVRETLANLKKDFPGYNGAGYELAGFVWYHGWNDGVSPKTGVVQYETNLVNLIRDVRREFNVPKLPFVIGELTGPWVVAPPEWTKLRQAQAAAAARPEFAGNVAFVPTHDFVRKPEDSPNPSHGHHEFGNAETYFLVGDALGKGMVSLLDGKPAASHQTNSIEGWRVLVNERLLKEEKAATEKALELLRVQLLEIVRVVPGPAVAKLREVPLWFSPAYPGVKPSAEYHPGAGWLRGNGRDPAMAKAVEITDVRDFEAEMKRMPNFILHELAHAYHDRVLPRGFDHAEIKAAFERAKAGKSYDKVERWFGNGRSNTKEKAYAMTSPMEYFAETTEAFFSRNDFFPFTREELKQHDPEMEQLLERLWNSPATRAGTGQVKPPPAELKVPAFYKKYLEADGYPIVASAKVNDYALKEAAYLVNLLLAKRPDVRAAMIKSGSRLCIIAHDEFTTDLPEWAWMTPKDYWDARARGMGGSADDPLCSCGEENLLAYPGDPYAAENILIHEFAHNIHLRGMVNVDPTFDARVQAAYDSAMKSGLWKGKYAAVNHHEYFAEGVQSWFDNNRVNDHDHNHVHLRSQLIDYDPGLAALCREVFGDTVLKYTKPATRLRDHLAGYDPATSPKFVWPERLTKVKAEIKQKAQARSDAAEKSTTATPKEPVK